MSGVCDCGQEHERIESKVDDIGRLLEVHQAEVHGKLADVEQIRIWDGQLEAEIEELATAMLGPRRSELAGGGRDVTQGFDWQWRHFTTNGGVPAKWDSKTWAAIITVIVTTIGSIIVNLIEHLPPGPTVP